MTQQQTKKLNLAELCIDVGSGQAIVKKDNTIEFNDCGDNLTPDDLNFIERESREFIKYRNNRLITIDEIDVKEEKSMTFEKALNLVWTDGGNPTNDFYFDGAGKFNTLLLSMFASDDSTIGHGRCDGIPFYTNVMGFIKSGSKVKCTVRLEVIEKEN